VGFHLDYRIRGVYLLRELASLGEEVSGCSTRQALHFVELAFGATKRVPEVTYHPLKTVQFS